MFHIVLIHPEIPPNTGNIIRLCANTGAQLHLVEPLGFSLEDRALRRAGLDYHEYASVQVHANWQACRQALANIPWQRWFALTTKGTASAFAPSYRAHDIFVFGRETAGLPSEILAEFDPTRCLRLPMRPENRSLNLSNAAAVLIYEAWRQLDFSGAL